MAASAKTIERVLGWLGEFTASQVDGIEGEAEEGLRWLQEAGASAKRALEAEGAGVQFAPEEKRARRATSRKRGALPGAAAGAGKKPPRGGAGGKENKADAGVQECKADVSVKGSEAKAERNPPPVRATRRNTRATATKATAEATQEPGAVPAKRATRGRPAKVEKTEKVEEVEEAEEIEEGKKEVEEVEAAASAKEEEEEKEEKEAAAAAKQVEETVAQEPMVSETMNEGPKGGVDATGAERVEAMSTPSKEETEGDVAPEDPEQMEEEPSAEVEEEGEPTAGPEAAGPEAGAVHEVEGGGELSAVEEGDEEGEEQGMQEEAAATVETGTEVPRVAATSLCASAAQDQQSPERVAVQKSSPGPVEDQGWSNEEEAEVVGVAAPKVDQPVHEAEDVMHEEAEGVVGAEGSKEGVDTVIVAEGVADVKMGEEIGAPSPGDIPAPLPRLRVDGPAEAKCGVPERPCTPQQEACDDDLMVVPETPAEALRSVAMNRLAAEEEEASPEPIPVVDTLHASSSPATLAPSFSPIGEAEEVRDQIGPLDSGRTSVDQRAEAPLALRKLALVSKTTPNFAGPGTSSSSALLEKIRARVPPRNTQHSAVAPAARASSEATSGAAIVTLPITEHAMSTAVGHHPSPPDSLGQLTAAESPTAAARVSTASTGSRDWRKFFKDHSGTGKPSAAGRMAGTSFGQQQRSTSAAAAPTPSSTKAAVAVPAAASTTPSIATAGGAGTGATRPAWNGSTSTTTATGAAGAREQDEAKAKREYLKKVIQERRVAQERQHSATVAAESRTSALTIQERLAKVEEARKRMQQESLRRVAAERQRAQQQQDMRRAQEAKGGQLGGGASQALATRETRETTLPATASSTRDMVAEEAERRRLAGNVVPPRDYSATAAKAAAAQEEESRMRAEAEAEERQRQVVAAAAKAALAAAVETKTPAAAVKPNRPSQESYVISPYRESESEEDSEDESRPKKHQPRWARGGELKEALARQVGLDPDRIFNSRVNTCPLDEVFAVVCPVKKKKYLKRGSSGNWLKDRLTIKEEEDYRKAMEFR